MSQATTFSTMVFKSSFSYLHIEDVSYTHQINQHARLSIKLSLEEAVAKRLIAQPLAQETVRLMNKENQEVLFAGVIQYVSVSMMLEVWYAELTIETATILLDLKRQKRSFQNLSQTYQQVIETAMSSYKQVHCLNLASLHRSLPSMILQYDETDWQLAQRVAAINKSFLVPDIADARPRFWIGLKEGRSITPSKAAYKVTKRYQKNWDARENFQRTESLVAFNQISFQTTKHCSLGDYVLDDGIKHYIVEKQAAVSRGMLEFSYVAVPKKGFADWLIQRKKNIGLSLEGKVIAIKGRKVKVHLDIDAKQSKEQAVWLPYTTESSTMTYYMPEIGSRVKVYFPDVDTKHASAIMGIRHKSESYQDEMADPTTKILSNVQGKKISLEPHELTLVSDNNLSISLVDSSNIGFSSSSDVQVSSEQLLSFSAQTINVTADKEVKIQGQSMSSIDLAANIQLSAPDIKYSGGTGIKAKKSKLEGSKNKSKKRKDNLQAIQDLDRLEITSIVSSMMPLSLTDCSGYIKTAAAMVPITSITAVTEKQEKIVSTKAVNTIESSNAAPYRAKIKRNSFETTTNNQLINKANVQGISLQPNGQKTIASMVSEVQKVEITKVTDFSIKID